VSASTAKALREARAEIAWLTGKLARAHVYTLPLTHEGGEAFTITLVRLEATDRWAIVAHRPMAAQVWLDGVWVDSYGIPAEAFTHDVVEAHRLADVLAAREGVEHAQWRLRHDAERPVTADEFLAEYATPRQVSA
jgi:hypothetical protein